MDGLKDISDMSSIEAKSISNTKKDDNTNVQKAVT